MRQPNPLFIRMFNMPDYLVIAKTIPRAMRINLPPITEQILFIKPTLEQQIDSPGLLTIKRDNLLQPALIILQD